MEVTVKIPEGGGCNDLNNLLVEGLSVQNGNVPGCNLTPAEKLDVIVVSTIGVFQSTMIVRD